MIEIEGLDHLVLTVNDINSSIEFYTRILGMQVIDFAGHRKALKFGQQKINLHPAGENWEERNYPATGSADICLVTKTPMRDVIKHLERNNIKILEGPVKKSGATGAICSIFFNDPDRNLIEVSRY